MRSSHHLRHAHESNLSGVFLWPEASIFTKYVYFEIRYPCFTIISSRNLQTQALKLARKMMFPCDRQDSRRERKMLYMRSQMKIILERYPMHSTCIQIKLQSEGVNASWTPPEHASYQKHLPTQIEGVTSTHVSQSSNKWRQTDVVGMGALALLPPGKALDLQSMTSTIQR